MVAFASWEKAIRLWGSGTGAPRSMFVVYTGWVGPVTLSLDGQLVASTSEEGMVMLWGLRRFPKASYHGLIPDLVLHATRGIFPSMNLRA